MDDLISRQAVLKLIIGSIYDLHYFSDNDALCDDIKRLPAIQPDMVSAYEKGYEDCLSLQPDRKTGHWIDREHCQVNEDLYDIGICSVCGAEITIDPLYDNYCPQCGADMRGDRDE